MVAPLVVMRMGLKPGKKFARAPPLRVCRCRAAGLVCCAEAAATLASWPAASIPNEPFKKFRRFDVIDYPSFQMESALSAILAHEFSHAADSLHKSGVCHVQATEGIDSVLKKQPHSFACYDSVNDPASGG